jgi:septum formation protein
MPGRFLALCQSPLLRLVESPPYPQGCSTSMSLVLASASPIRRQMLDSAGVAHTVDPARVDEDSLKRDFAGDDRALAVALAEAKAIETAARLSGKWVIGGDSLVSLDGRRFDKPTSRENAAAHLRAFAGRTMILTSAVALARDGSVEWSQAEEARLEVRHFDDEFIHNYLEAEWPAVAGCVGVFRMEGRGVQLFDRVEGSHFTILGMPLLPLLGALRARGLIAG